MVCSPVVWNVITPLPRPSHPGRQHPGDSQSPLPRPEVLGCREMEREGPPLRQPAHRTLLSWQSRLRFLRPRPGAAHWSPDLITRPRGDLTEAGACRCQRSISLRCEPPAGRRAPRGQRFASPGSQRRGEACPALPLTGPSVSPGSSEPRCSNPGAWHCFLSDMIAPICARQLAPRSAILGSWLAADNTFKHAVAIYWPYKLILVGVQLIEIKA